MLEGQDVVVLGVILVVMAVATVATIFIKAKTPPPMAYAHKAVVKEVMDNGDITAYPLMLGKPVGDFIVLPHISTASGVLLEKVIPDVEKGDMVTVFTSTEGSCFWDIPNKNRVY